VVDSNTFFLSGEALYPYKIWPCRDSDLLWHTFVSLICGYVHHQRRGFNIVTDWEDKRALTNFIFQARNWGTCF
jgi:hypothetical protein